MEENNSVFRQKSLDRISSPEDLDKYIKTTTPSLWVLLLAVIIFLAGVIVWGVVGKLETASDIGCKASGGKAECYIKETDYENISDVSYVEVEDSSYEIKKVEGPFAADEKADAYLLHNSDIEAGEWYYSITVEGLKESGNMKARIVYETISPIKFILN